MGRLAARLAAGYHPTAAQQPGRCNSTTSTAAQGQGGDGGVCSSREHKRSSIGRGGQPRATAGRCHPHGVFSGWMHAIDCRCTHMTDATAHYCGFQAEPKPAMQQRQRAPLHCTPRALSLRSSPQLLISVHHILHAHFQTSPTTLSCRLPAVLSLLAPCAGANKARPSFLPRLPRRNPCSWLP